MDDPQTYAIIGAAMAVHRELGCGFLEAVYHEGLAIEFLQNHIPSEHEVELSIFYKGRQMNQKYRADFICFGDIVVEVKAISKLTLTEESQIINYLNASKINRGLLINFGANTLEYKRFNNSKNNQKRLINKDHPSL